MCQTSISDNDVLNALFILAPQYYTTDPTIINQYYQLINLVRCQINTQILSCCGVMVFAFLVAHYLTLQTNPNLGMAANLHEGQLSVGFNVSADMGFLLLTPYGRAYADLIKRTVVGSTVTNLPVNLGGVATNAPWGCCGQGLGAWPYAIA
jgi:hypothetical protein